MAAAQVGQAPIYPASGGPAGFGGPGGQSMANGISGTQRQFERAQSIPGPGTVLGLPDDPYTPGGTSGQTGVQWRLR